MVHIQACMRMFVDGSTNLHSAHSSRHCFLKTSLSNINILCLSYRAKTEKSMRGFIK